jgi:anti-sigma factor RsiW
MVTALISGMIKTMQPCSYIPRISAYHDGELPADRRAEIELHLRGCDQCAAELTDLRRLSQLLGAQAVPSLSPAGAQRLHGQIDEMTSRSLIRFVEMLSGVAAALLIASSLWALRTTSVTAEPLPPWQQAAVTLQPAASNQPQAIRTVEWMVSELAPDDSND